MGRDLLFAGGFARPYKTDLDEIRASGKTNGWHPATVDFKATADASGGGSSVSNLTDVLNFLRNKPDGSVDELAIIGHASARAFAMGGEIIVPKGPEPGNVRMTSFIDDQTLINNAAVIGSIKAKFAANARIALYGCHAGLGTSLLNAVAKAFGICVVGFSDPITTGFLVTDGSPPRITSRGHVFVDSAGLLNAGLGPPVSTWSKDIGTLSPDRKSENCP